LFVTIIVSDQLIVAITLPLVIVHEAGVYSIVAVGAILSIHDTIPVTLHVLHIISLKVKVNVSLPVNV